MKAKIIDGRALAEAVKDKLVQDILRCCGDQAKTEQDNIVTMSRPNLAIILVGSREDSRLYVSIKEKEAKKIGIDTHLYKCPENISQAEVLELIDCLNQDRLIDAILVQLPLPQALNTDVVIRAIDPAKDVDRFHPDNLAVLFNSCDHNQVMPPVFEAVLTILSSVNCDLVDKKVCIIANSELFGKSLAQVLACRGAQAELVLAGAADLADKAKTADVLISAVGQPKLIKGAMVKTGAVIIDIGITKNGSRVQGDVDFNEVKDRAGFITPVPGGVGPLTIAMLFKNTLELYQRRQK